MKCSLFFAGLLLLGSALGTAAPTPPNIIFIVADDLGYADLGVQGSKDIPTPHLDSLAASGVRFTNGYSNHSVCSPMRAGFLTGRYQHRFGYETNVPYDPRNPFLGLPNEEKTIADRLRAAGYATAAIGKWHLGAHAQKHPNRRGFDFFYGFLGGGHDYFAVDLSVPDNEGYKSAILRNGSPESINGYLTDRFTDEAIQWIQQPHPKPFFLYLAYNAPHTPLQATEEKLKQFAAITDPKRRTYAAMISSVDDGVGRILQTLEKQNLRSNTLIAFLSDNGGPIKPNASSNAPLRGQKGNYFEGGIRVPFFVSWPDHFPAGRVDPRPVIALDLSVTALHLAAADTSGHLDGVNLAPALAPDTLQQPIHEALFWRSKLNSHVDFAVRAGPWKLVDTDTSGPHLFNLDSDLSEQQPADQPEISTQLRKLWDEWNQPNRDPAFPSFGAYHPMLDTFHKRLRDSGSPPED